MNYTEKEILTLIKDEKKSEKFFSILTGEDVKRLLLYVNSRVRNIPIKENRISRDTLCAGDMVSPSNDIQDRYFEKVSDALKNVKGKKDRATMMYYLINQLHLFDDGNGRTSRAVFEIINNQDFSFDNNDALIHNDKFNVAKINHLDFQDNNNIEGTIVAEVCSNCFLYKALIKCGIIPNKDFFTSKIQIMTDADPLLTITPDKVAIDNDPIFIPDNVKKQISLKQYYQIQDSLADNNGKLITTSGMALLLIAIENKKIGDLSKYEYGNRRKVNFTC